tara:strand:- start:256 stop:459 length:204 start_codon:yes stop_codon:yes gene_type:complete
MKPSVTIHRSASGVLKVLECSEDASKCLDAYKACEEPGQIVYIRKGHTDKQKKIVGQPALKPKKAKK